MMDRLDQSELQRAMGSLAREVELSVWRELDSTNNQARRCALEGRIERPMLIAAQRQTAGRGRLGRAFYSPNGTGVYFTVLYPVGADRESAVTVTCAAAVAVMRAIRNRLGRQTEIKWVNDLFFKNRKVCGILTEAFTVGERTYAAVGIGINLRPSTFPKELCDVAGSLDEESVPRSEVIAEVVRELLPFLRDPTDRSWLADYREHSLVIGRQISWTESGNRTEGEAEGVNERGELLVRARDGKERILRTGEITIRLME